MTGLKYKVAGRALRALCAFMAVLLLTSSFVACSWKETITVDGEKCDFNAMTADELAEYIEIGQYKGLEISLSGRSKGEAAWDTVAELSTVKHYPEGHVYYYIEQFEGQYKYYAEEAGVTYEALLEELGINEGSITKEAKAMTEKDIVYSIVRKLEDIELTEDEKQTYFAKYVQKYVSEYGYSEEYVTANMSDLIYESMLYDKTTEFLIVNNTFVE